jgi:hypothetical protein
VSARVDLPVEMLLLMGIYKNCNDDAHLGRAGEWHVACPARVNGV